MKSQESEWLSVEIEKIIRFDTEINFKKVPGFVVGIIDGDSTYILPYGHRKDSKKSGKLTGDDIFEVGSITKVFTAYIINKLVQEKRLFLFDKVNDYLSDEYANPRLSHLTIQSLINHQSGLPLRPEMFGAREKEWQNPYLYYTNEHLLEFYRDYIPEKDGYVYSHVNYALLEIIIERVTELDFDDIIKQYLLDPFKLKHTFLDFPEQKENYICPGYDKTVSLVKPWIFSSFRASEGLKTSAFDVLSFIKSSYFSVPDSTNFDQPFDPSLNTINPGINDYLYIENGWHILPIKNFKVAVHTGRTSGHSCFLGMVENTKTAVVVFSNSWVGTGDLGLQILRMINQNWKK
ncbi:MAG: serine hydrolase domain-containing protein [Saprospiraceae bacterium]